MSELPKKEFVFDYSKYKTKSISLAQLDKIFEIVVAPATSYIQMIAKAIQLILIGIYIFVRSKLVDQEYKIQKQEYEQRQNNNSRVEIDGEDMDNT
jgi:large-conductance mechanosensitive channel